MYLITTNKKDLRKRFIDDNPWSNEEEQVITTMMKAIIFSATKVHFSNTLLSSFSLFNPSMTIVPTASQTLVTIISTFS